jgi:hypothetical protein
MKIFEMKKVYISVPRIIYPQYQPDWDGKDYKKLESLRVETIEEIEALEGDYVLSFKEVTDSVKPTKTPKKAPPKKQPKLEV